VCWKLGQAVANTILKKYVVEKGSYLTKAARVVAVMGSLTQRDHSLEVVGSGRDEELFKTLTAIAGSGTLVHGGEDGSELYLLDKPGSERAFGRRSMEQLTNHVFPKLGKELYLNFEGHGAGLYDAVISHRNTLRPSSPPRPCTSTANFSSLGLRGYPVYCQASSQTRHPYPAGT